MPNTSEPPDDVLIVALADRDLSAMAGLYDCCGRPAYALAYRIMGEGEAAEELANVVKERIGPNDEPHYNLHVALGALFSIRPTGHDCRVPSTKELSSIGR